MRMLSQETQARLIELIKKMFLKENIKFSNPRSNN